MKKFILAFLVIAVLGTTGFVAVRQYGKSKTDPPQTTTSVQQTSSASAVSASTSAATTTTTTTTATEPTVGTPAFVTFQGTIRAVNGSLLMVAPQAGTEAAKYGSEVSVDCSQCKLTDANGKTVLQDDVANFSSVTVTFNGEVRETYPVSLTATQAALSDRTACNVYFYLDGKVIATRKVTYGAALDAADMPNAGAYVDDGYHFECWQQNGTPVYALERVTDSVELHAKISED